MHSLSPFGHDTQRYWDKRYELFSKFDEGIQIDREGLYSVKPEAIVRDIASKLQGNYVYDAFCGVGGSAIGFAAKGKRVLTTDIDPNKLRMARHNAEIYGIADKIEFRLASCLDVLQGMEEFDALHFDPPWGSVDYWKKDKFLLQDFTPDGNELMELAIKRNFPIAWVLPKNFDQTSLSFGRPWHIEPNYSGDRLIFSTLYVMPS